MNQLNPVHGFTLGESHHTIYHGSPGEGLPRHEHTYPHVTICHAGRIAVRKENKEVELTPTSTPVLLVANEWHEIEALEEGTVFHNIYTLGQ